MTAFTLTNYADLLNILSTTGGFLHRNDTADILPVCVQMCETTINYGDGDQIAGLRTAAQETTASLTCTPGTQTVALPSDFLEIRRIYITVSGVRRELIGRPISPISVTDSANVNAIPETFFITGSNLYLDPIPYQAFVITLLYYAKVGPLATSSTNWLMTAAPMVYLGGTVMHGAPWFGQNYNPAPWVNMFTVGMRQVARKDMSRFKSTQLRSEASQMISGNSGGYAAFVGGQ